MSGSSVGIVGNRALEQCDYEFAVAGLRPLWIPEPTDVPQDMIDLSSRILAFADNDSLDPVEKALVEGYSFEAFNFIRKLFYEHQEGSFRAQVAKNKRIGNCIAHHEALTGINRAMGLEPYSVGIWQGINNYSHIGNHASSGLLLGNTFVTMDAYANVTGFMSDDEAWYQGIEDAVDFGTATLIGESEGADKILREEIEISDLNGIDLTKNRSYKRLSLIMPAASAVLMYSAVAASRSGSEDYKWAKEVLSPYAAVL